MGLSPLNASEMGLDFLIRSSLIATEQWGWLQSGSTALRVIPAIKHPLGRVALSRWT